ncbi:MAG TPA: hypothetical protein VIS99_11110, partial [Terrimicrobiaceae bacterium]
MKPPANKRLSKRLGSALVMTLVIIVLITVVTVGYLASVMLETKTAGASLDQERAYGVAMIGVHEAMSRLCDALGPWDDPYKNFATNAPPFYWSISPGRITRWSYTSLTQTNFALFSESTGTNLVNLNRPLSDGSYPIIGGGTPPEVSVKWANVLRDPSQAAGSDNPIIGRYAFWVDDEGAKININTADGTEKYTTNSLGVGSPSEVSLEVLFGGTNGKAPSKEIVAMARTNAFRSPHEILSATNVPPEVYTNNVFALTTYSRSPDLNVFGQPKMALLPIIGGANEFATNMVLNGITLRPPTEIYPTPSQLPGYRLTNRYLDEIDTRSWPLAFRQNRTDFNTGLNNPDYYSIRTTSTKLDNYCYVNGWMLANYLAGTNAAGTRVTWPAFPGPSGALTGGFAGKYTPRQIDNIVAQIVSLGSRAISSDYPYNSSHFAELTMEQTGMRYNVAPNLFPGWLSDELVIGMGRSMKLTKMLVKVTAYGSQTNVTPPVPKARMDIWLEWWIPGAYRGGNPVLPINGAAKIFQGNRGFPGVVNEKDLCASLDLTGGVPNPPAYEYLAAALPRDDNITKNYWGNQMLRNNQGIDFAANPTVRYDPDQPMAELYHDPWALDPNPPKEKYMGGGAGTTETGLNDTPFRMHFLQDAVPGVEWKPGEVRNNKNRIAPSARYPMRKEASGSLVVEGGIAVRSQIKDGSLSDPEPVPLDAARGPYRRGAQDTNEPLVSAYGPFDWYAQPEYWAINAVAGEAKGTLRQRILDAVIPVNVTVEIPEPESSAGNVKYVLAKVKGRDPLVNKFPGDWSLEEVSSPPAEFIEAYSPEDVFFNRYGESALRVSMTGPNLDPDSYWMPQADCALTQSESAPTLNLARQTLIFRSARMPNIGYLQYLRTGIIPDDEDSVPYISQHGTPFRLLSFAPSTEASDSSNPLVGQRTTRGGSQAYPDWALLDLLYIPSMLNSYGPGANGGPYNALTNLSYFGTFGGATSGRINPNGAVIYTTDVNTPQPGVSRTTPLQAALNGVRVNQTFNGTAANPEVWPYTGGTEMDSAESLRIAEAIERYIRDEGPL